MSENRRTGYYWVKVKGSDHWEVGSWDMHGLHTSKGDLIGCWVLLGSHRVWLDYNFEAIGPRIPEPNLQ